MEDRVSGLQSAFHSPHSRCYSNSTMEMENPPFSEIEEEAGSWRLTKWSWKWKGRVLMPTNCIHVTPDGRTLWIVGAGGMVLNSTDAGRTWRYQQPSAPSDCELTSVFASTDGRRVWVVGKD